MKLTQSPLMQAMMTATVLTAIPFFAFGALATDFRPDTLLKPTVSFTGAPATAADHTTFQVTATDESESGKTATITATGSCSVPSGSTVGTVTVTMTLSTGTCTVKAAWAADTKYAAATAAQTTAAYLGYAESVIDLFDSQNYPDGIGPRGNGFIFDTAGNLYATVGTASRDNGGGAIVELSPESGGIWKETVLYIFNPRSTGFNGYHPVGTLTMDSKGNFYGVTANGGTGNCSIPSNPPTVLRCRCDNCARCGQR